MPALRARVRSPVSGADMDYSRVRSGPGKGYPRGVCREYGSECPGQMGDDMECLSCRQAGQHVTRRDVSTRDHDCPV